MHGNVLDKSKLIYNKYVKTDLHIYEGKFTWTVVLFLLILYTILSIYIWQ